MTRTECMEQFSALEVPAILAVMTAEGYTGNGNFDDVIKYSEKVLDRIAKTSAATLEGMTDWTQVMAHASGKNKAPRRAADLPADITGAGFRIEFNAPADRVQLLFDKFPTQEARQIVKDCGFWWSPSLKCWQRKMTRKAERAADEAAQRLTDYYLH